MTNFEIFVVICLLALIVPILTLLWQNSKANTANTTTLKTVSNMAPILNEVRKIVGDIQDKVDPQKLIRIEKLIENLGGESTNDSGIKEEPKALEDKTGANSKNQ